MNQINWARTRDILICIICIGVIFWASWTVLGQFVEAIVILLIAMAIAFLLSPLVDFLVKYKIPRIVATLFVYILVLGAIGGLSYELVFTLIQQATAFSDTLYNFTLSLPKTFQETINFLEVQDHISPDRINTIISQIQDQAYSFAQSTASNAVTIVFLLTNAFVNILLVVVLSFYLTLDGKRIRDSLISLSPRRFLPNVLLFEDALNRVVGNYIRGQLTLALIVGIFTSLACVTTGLGDYALICGVLAFLFETIPMVGPSLASITPILLSLLLPDPFPRTFEIVVWFVVIQMLESNILGPRIVGHAVGLHPVAAILSLLVGAKLFGVFGALLATPVVAALWVVVASIYRSARGESADQILSRKRAPWTLRRPKGRSAGGGSSGHDSFDGERSISQSLDGDGSVMSENGWGAAQKTTPTQPATYASLKQPVAQRLKRPSQVSDADDHVPASDDSDSD
jgi:predicted PurR-regulated permease PerM